MGIFDDEQAARPAPRHEIGQDLSLLSVADLRERIEMLKSEIVRIEGELHKKGHTRTAAEALFRKA